MVNLSPADVLKEGSHYDLPIAVGLPISMGVLQKDELDEYAMLDELAIDGTSPSRALPAAIGANAAERGLICPAVGGMGRRDPAWRLINHLSHPIRAPSVSPYLDLRDMQNGLEAAAGGGHNVLMVGQSAPAN